MSDETIKEQKGHKGKPLQTAHHRFSDPIIETKTRNKKEDRK
jgi:hypothetical protein